MSDQSNLVEQRCSHCGIWKTLDEFNLDSGRKIGRHHRCRQCNKEMSKTPLAKEKHNSYSRKNRHKYIDRIRIKHQEWKKTPAGKALDKRYRQTDKRKSVLKKYAKSELGRVTGRRNGDKYNSRKKELPNTLTPNEWEEVRSSGKCFYCGKSDVGLQKDHYIPVSLGGPTTADNIVASCEKCNKSKGNRHPDVFMKEMSASNV